MKLRHSSSFNGFSLLMGAKAVTLPLNLFISILLIRTLKISDYGWLTIILTLASFFDTFFDFGLGAIFTKRASRSKKAGHLLFPHFIGSHLILLFFLPLISYFVAYLLSYSPTIRIGCLVISLSNGLLVLSSFYRIPNYINKSFLSETILVIFTQIIKTLVVSLLYFSTSPKLTSYVVYTLFGSVLILVSSIIFTYKTHQITIRPSLPSFKHLIAWAKNGVPFVGLGILTLLAFRLDTILISKLLTIKDVGLYQASYRFVDLSIAVSGVLFSIIYPIYSRLIRQQTNLIQYAKSIEVSCFILATPFLVVGFIYADKILTGLYGTGFFQGTNTLRILFLCPIFFYLNCHLGTLLFAAGKQNINFFNSLFVLTINFLGNFLFLKQNGIIISAIMTLFSEIILFIFNMYATKQLHLKHSAILEGTLILTISVLFFIFLNALCSVWIINCVIFILLYSFSMYFYLKKNHRILFNQ